MLTVEQLAPFVEVVRKKHPKFVAITYSTQNSDARNIALKMEDGSSVEYTFSFAYSQNLSSCGCKQLTGLSFYNMTAEGTAIEGALLALWSNDPVIRKRLSTVVLFACSGGDQKTAYNFFEAAGWSRIIHEHNPLHGPHERMTVWMLNIVDKESPKIPDHRVPQNPIPAPTPEPMDGPPADLPKRVKNSRPKPLKVAAKKLVSPFGVTRMIGKRRLLKNKF